MGLEVCLGKKRIVGKLASCNSFCAYAFWSPSARNFPTLTPVPANLLATAMYESSNPCFAKVKGSHQSLVETIVRSTQSFYKQTLHGNKFLLDRSGTKGRRARPTMDSAGSPTGPDSQFLFWSGSQHCQS